MPDKLWEIRPGEVTEKVVTLKHASKTAVKWPAPADLQAMLWDKPVVEIARTIGVSDVAVVKHAAKHGLTKPPRVATGWKQSSERAAR